MKFSDAHKAFILKQGDDGVSVAVRQTAMQCLLCVQQEGGGYVAIQGTRPQTLAYALTF